MSSNTYLRVFKNRFYANDSVVPFKGQDGRFRFVYKITNKVSGYVYIGQHIVNKRYDDPLTDNYKGSGIVLKRAKQKYDWYKDFTFEVLEFYPDQQSLNQGEAEYINNFKGLSYNLAQGGRGGITHDKQQWMIEHHEQFEQVKRQLSEQRSYRVLIVCDFVSPLNGKEFKAGTIFKSAFTASLEVGYKSKTSLSVIFKQHQGFWFTKEKGYRCGYRFNTAFKYLKDNEVVSEQRLIELQNEVNEQVEQFYCDHKKRIDACVQKSIETIARGVKVCKSFTSPLNNRYFEEGHVFKTLKEAARAIGLKDGAVQNILYNKHHPGDWFVKCGRKTLYVTTFTYADQ